MVLIMYGLCRVPGDCLWLFESEIYNPKFSIISALDVVSIAEVFFFCRALVTKE